MRRRDDVSHTSIAVLVVIIAICCALQAKKAWGQDGAHGNGHAEVHDKYKNWHAPNNPSMSCCNNDDCRPTRAFVDDDGQWRAWNGLKWLIVPWERVLPTDFAGDGRSHLCEKGEYIYCFSPGPPRS